MNDNFPIALCLIDKITSNNCCNNIQKELIITNINETIKLQNNFILNLLELTNNKLTVLIQNGNLVIIRNILPNLLNDILLEIKVINNNNFCNNIFNNCNKQPNIFKHTLTIKYIYQ